MNTYLQSLLRNNYSALSYKKITISDGDYEITDGQNPFKGIHLNADGNVEILGITDDEESVILTLTAGSHALGGIGIKAAGTTVTDLVLLF